MTRCDLCHSQHNVTQLCDEYKTDGVSDTCEKCTQEPDEALVKYRKWWSVMMRRETQPFVWRVMEQLKLRKKIP